MDDMVLMLQGAMAAEGKVGLMMNVRKSDLQAVLSILPALQNPTISSLSDPEWVAVNTILDENVVRHIVPQLEAGRSVRHRGVSAEQDHRISLGTLGNKVNPSRDRQGAIFSPLPDSRGSVFSFGKKSTRKPSKSQYKDVGQETDMMSDGLKKTLEQLRQTLAPAEESGRTDGQLLASFVANRDESAFAALVRRHGRMVFGVCRRVLRHVQDAEDAFQATFLVLACKASSLRDGEAVGNWLYGVAYRTALESKTRKARRRSREQPLDNVPSPEVSTEEPRDWLPLLERAVNGLPQRYRMPLVLCHLEGRSRQEVARQLGLPDGTLSSRLATARRLLAKRLARHQQALSMGVILAALADESASAAVPASLLVATIQDALRIAAGQTIATPAAVLMKEVMQMMLLTKLKFAGVFLAAVGVMGMLAASFFAPMRAADEKPAEPKPAPQPAAQEKLVKKITHRENDIGDVESLLHIRKQMCEVELKPLKDRTLLGVDIEVYKDGRKMKTYKEGNVSAAKAIGAKIALLAADLDYLRLADAHEKHCRMKIELKVYSDEGSAGTASEIDIPKELFDFTRVNSQYTFSAEGGSATEMPLFWFQTNRSNEFIGANTMAELLKRNPKGDFLTVYLRVRKK